MLNKCFAKNKVYRLYRQSKIITILKPGKDCMIPKYYRLISILYHMYKLYEKLTEWFQLLKDTSSMNRHVLGLESHAPASC